MRGRDDDCVRGHPVEEVDAQPLAVLVITSAGSPAQAGLTVMGWLAEAESLPLGFCTEPGLGVTMAILLFAVQTVSPGA